MIIEEYENKNRVNALTSSAMPGERALSSNQK
jgi:hypothetical protein